MGPLLVHERPQSDPPTALHLTNYPSDPLANKEQEQHRKEDEDIEFGTHCAVMLLGQGGAFSFLFFLFFTNSHHIESSCPEGTAQPVLCY